MCADGLMWGWGNRRGCLRKGEHDKHLADVGSHMVEWWGPVGSTHYTMTEKTDFSLTKKADSDAG